MTTTDESEQGQETPSQGAEAPSESPQAPSEAAPEAADATATSTEGASKAGAGDASKADAGTEKGAKGKSAKAKKPEAPRWTPPPKDRLDGAVEALLLAAGDVLKLNRVRDLLGLPSKQEVRDAIGRISLRWAEADLAVEIEEVAKGVRVVTRPEYAEYVGRLRRKPAADKLTKSLLETLSIVAYKQPTGRAEVERIRGVQAGEALRGLLERGLLKVVGRSDQPGRPLLYGTTDRFLTVFGLKDLKDLPSHGDLGKL